MRVEVFLESAPQRRVLLSIEDGGARDALLDAVELRLGTRPKKMCLGETQAEVVSAADLRDGDVVRVVAPAAAAAADAAVSPDTELAVLPAWRAVVHLVLTLVIFLIFFSGFQTHVVARLFGEADSGAPAESVEILL